MSTVLISAGETSGDIYGAKLTAELKRRGHRVIGFGGSAMEAAGAEIKIELTKFALVGFLEVLSKLNGVLSVFFKAVKILKEEKPDVLVVIDYPGFNMKLIENARKMGIKRIVYFITPQVWAWKYKRIYRIKKFTDLSIVVLPFEKTMFDKEGINAVYYGHPMAQMMKEINIKNSDIKPRENLVGIFPGSRESELKRFFDDVLDSCDELAVLVPNVKFLVFRAPGISREFLEKKFSRYPKFKYEITEGNDYISRKRLAAAIAKSGTTTLELALLEVPQVVVYKINPLSYIIFRMLMTKQYLKFISLPNIVAGREVVRELVQGGMHPGAVALETARLLRDFDYRSFMINEYRKIDKLLYHDAELFGQIADAVIGKP